MLKLIGKLFWIVFLCNMVMGCNSTPEPFETGVRTPAPYGYTEMLKREAK